MDYKERGLKISEAKRMSLAEFVQRASIKHNNQYNYQKVIYTNAHTKVIITCPIHGDWEQKPLVHLANGCGCPACGNIMKGIKKKEAAYKKFLLFANKKHNNKYRYIDESFNGITDKMTIICPTHGSFQQSPDVHKRAGCQRCGSGPVSEQSQKWLDSLNVCKEHREIWLTFPARRIKVDAFNPITNTVYEYWGDYWHGNPKVYNLDCINKNNKRKFRELYEETLERIELIRSVGYNLVQVWENEWLYPAKDDSSS